MRTDDRNLKNRGWLTPRRIYEEELLDAGAGSEEDVASNLKDLRLINRRLGGSRPVVKALVSLFSADPPESISILDVGTGSADIPGRVIDWCRSRGIACETVALDVSDRNLRVTRRRLGFDPSISLLQADARLLPFQPRSFDIVIASQFLHHFEDQEVAELLASFASLARRAVVVNDLARNLVPYYFIRMTGWLFTRSFLTRNDGPVSVLRGFTAHEFVELGKMAGLGRFTVSNVFPYRLLLVADTEAV
jgi:2-polyprenyl-3-methyl-5-hydroxy-6-metoxy-1,4-benzoquinol methylase